MGDEFNYVCEYKNYQMVELIEKKLPKHNKPRPSMTKFANLMQKISFLKLY